mmetsp:Transcript_27028/g.39530  ORF Transcript_27028/g.39530 Transcript_27028/m.39530 type:complete len:538 (-) Transcript_27028:186-1799(-)
MPNSDGGLGQQLVGDKVGVNHRTVQVTRLIGEGGFSYVYLVKDITEPQHAQQHQLDPTGRANGSSHGAPDKKPIMVLKVTSIHSRQQRDIAEKEAKLLSRLSHPSIIKMYDACYRTATDSRGLMGGIVGVAKENAAGANSKDGRPQHMILMEFCEGGHALDVCNKLAAAGQRFDLSALIIAFGQICNAVSYLHAQRPPIVHRDLKPVNFLVKNGAYKLCDFGSAVFGHVELKTQSARAEAEEVIQKTTTQMFRAPEMVDLYSTKKLTQSTDVWALGCCLYSLAFLQNCFEEGSNLAILSRKYKIPDDNPYGDGLVELIDRMLTVDAKARSDMTEVILCLSAIYSRRPLPPRKNKGSKDKKKDGAESEGVAGESGKEHGKYNTDGQGVKTNKSKVVDKKKAEAKMLNPNSAAARRKKAAQTHAGAPIATDFNASFSVFSSEATQSPKGGDDQAFAAPSPFPSVQETDGDGFPGFEGDGARGSSDFASGAFGDEGGAWPVNNGENPPAGAMEAMQLGEDGGAKREKSRSRRKSSKKEER